MNSSNTAGERSRQDTATAPSVPASASSAIERLRAYFKTRESGTTQSSIAYWALEQIDHAQHTSNSLRVNCARNAEIQDFASVLESAAETVAMRALEIIDALHVKSTPNQESTR